MSDPPNAALPPLTDAVSISSSSSLWDRITSWASDHKATVYTIAGVTLVVTAAGVVYYSSSGSQDTPADLERRRARKDKKKAKKTSDKSDGSPCSTSAESTSAPTVEAEPELPNVTEAGLASMSEQDRKDTAAKLKVAGNKSYGGKDYKRAIELYSQALMCSPDPVFYSNRAACHNALSDYEKVIQDTTAALAIDHEYVKALNRRANAYEATDKNSEALLDFTASCIIDGFKNDAAAQAVERLLKKVAEKKAAAILASRKKKLPSPTFVSNYLQSFRPKALPTSIDESAVLPENSGKALLRKGLLAMGNRSAKDYQEACDCFEKAIEAGDLGDCEALAYNMRGTFTYLQGADGAMKDLEHSIELDKTMIQSYVKLASMHLEAGDREKAKQDFDSAMEHDDKEPDIYYHRAQLNFILGDFGEAARDYAKSIELDGKFIFSHIQLGVTQYKMGSIASAMATFRRCIKNFDKVPDVYNYYGEILLDQQKYVEAIDKFEKSIELEKAARGGTAAVAGEGQGINVLPQINKALALFQWKQDFKAAEDLCQEALKIDPECDIAIATMAQLLLQQGKVTDALTYFERAAELSRTEVEIVNALSYAEATRTQLEVQEKYPQLASRLQAAMGPGAGAAGAGGAGGAGAATTAAGSGTTAARVV